MAKTKVTYDVVREIGLAMPEVEDGSSYGALALKVRGSLLACVATNKSAEPGSLVVRIDFDQRAALLAEAPETYYVTGHYVNYPAVLVRLSKIQPDQMRDLLGSAWKFVTSKKKRPALKTKGKQVTQRRKDAKPQRA